MTDIAPMPFRWEGDSMTPLRPKLADAYFVIGQVYTLVEHYERSESSHGHQFAFLTECWRNLPEDLADEYPNVEALRKKLLVKTGWYNETIIDAGTNAAALRVATALRGLDKDFAYIGVRGGFVVRREAKSQSYRAMNKADFQASKQALIDACGELIGVSGATLQANAGAAA